jgi:hypothetical protein
MSVTEMTEIQRIEHGENLDNLLKHINWKGFFHHHNAH